MPVAGRSAVFKVQNASGTLTDISAKLNSITFPQEIDTKDTTTFGATSKSYTVLLRDSKITINGYWDSTIDAHLAGIIGMSRSFEYGPQGSSAGSPKYTGNCILTSYNVEVSADDVMTFSAEFVVDGGVTRGTY
jgi:uncharacterized protein YxjI